MRCWVWFAEAEAVEEVEINESFVRWGNVGEDAGSGSRNITCKCGVRLKAGTANS